MSGWRGTTLADLRVAALRGCHPANRGWATLVAMGDLALPPLGRELESPDPEVRRWAAVVLRRIGTPGAWTMLGSMLSDPDPVVHLHAAVALARLGDGRAFAPLSELCRSGVPWMRWDVFAGLGELGDPRAVPILVDALREPDWNTRNQALAGLIRLGANAVPAIDPLLRDADPELRKAAITVLGKVGDPSRMPDLVAALGDPDFWVRVYAASALAAYPAGASALEGALADPEAFVRQTSCRSLGALGLPGTLDRLRPLLDDPATGVRHAACRAIAALDEPGVEALMVSLLSSAEASMLEDIIGALARCGHDVAPLEALQTRIHRLASGKGRKRLRRKLLFALTSIRARAC